MQWTGMRTMNSGMTGFRSAYEDTRRRSVDQADVEGSNPFGPTTNRFHLTQIQWANS